MTGILLVDKPPDVSSAGVIRALKPRLGAAKVGHLGTLDPFASGLLPLCIGEATKVARYLLLEQKAYTGVIRLGIATDTLDRTGAVVERKDVPPVGQDRLSVVGAQLTGRQLQVPPMYSALKRGGVPLYRLARRGIEVEREAREIVIDTLSLVLESADRVRFAVACSKGTYVRVLAADVGRALATVAHLEELRRTAVGAFTVEDARPLAALVDGGPGAGLPLVPIRHALSAMATHALAAADITRLRRGQQGALTRLPLPAVSGATALVVDGAGEVAAIIEAGGPGPSWRLVRLLGGGA